MRLDRALNFTPKLWDQVGQFVRGAIKDDALKGIMQDDKRPKLRSNQYKKYKKNDMRRFGRGKSKIGRGTRLGSRLDLKNGEKFESKNPKYDLSDISLNKDVSKVNLHLTGEMLKQVQVKSTSNSSRITFLQGKKVLGNKRHGYNVFGLRNKNRKNALRFLDRTIERNLEKETSKPITLKIGKR